MSEFVSFITSEASDKCQREKRKTINGDDILWAMSTLGFDKYIEPLKMYLSRYVFYCSSRLRGLDCAPYRFLFLRLGTPGDSFARTCHHCILGCLGTGY